MTWRHGTTRAELEDLDVGLSGGGPWAEALGRVTVRELAEADTGPPVRLMSAKKLTGIEFDGVVHEVLLEAKRFVRAGYVRARVGGPTWKLQHSLGRLGREPAVIALVTRVVRAVFEGRTGSDRAIDFKNL